MTNKELIKKLKELHAINVNGQPLTFPAFKNRTMVHKYGKDYKILFMGIPAKNLFGFYVMWGNDMECMKEAYGMYLRLIKGDMEDYENKDLQWGLRIPLAYGNMRQK